MIITEEIKTKQQLQKVITEALQEYCNNTADLVCGIKLEISERTE